MFIKNKEQLAITKKRKQTLEILEAGIINVDPRNFVNKTLQYNKYTNSLVVQNKIYDLISGRIFVIGSGKASEAMAMEVERIIGVDYIEAGIISVREKNLKLKKIKIIKASHPAIGENSLEAGKEILALKDKHNINEKDLVLCLISGGASSMMESFVEDVTLEDAQNLSRILEESNIARKSVYAIKNHISMIKGGMLGSYFAPARVVSIIISDVAGDDLSIIGSGPTVEDFSTFNDIYYILQQYKLLDKIPPRIKYYFEKGCSNLAQETPKKLSHCHNYVIASNKDALEGMVKKARELGLRAIIASSDIRGETKQLAEINKELIFENYPDYEVVILGGETSADLPIKHGKGGSNQHYALASLIEMRDLESDWLLACITSDGIDFLEDSAGAIIDKYSLEKMMEKKLNPQEFLASFDSHTFFKKIGNSLIKIGETGTNVGHMIIYMK